MQGVAARKAAEAQQSAAARTAAAGSNATAVLVTEMKTTVVRADGDTLPSDETPSDAKAQWAVRDKRRALAFAQSLAQRQTDGS